MEISLLSDKVLIKNRTLKENFIYHKKSDGLLIVTSGGEGMCMIYVDEKLKSCASIYNLSVEERYRRNGYGTKLIKEAENASKLLGITVLTMMVKIDSFMFDWYQRLGYKAISSNDGMATLYKEL